MEIDPETHYIPDIEDFHAGYECEMMRVTTTGKIWEQIKFNNDFTHTTDPDYLFQYLSMDLQHETIRTPWLTREQIEAEGWGMYGHFIMAEETVYNFFVRGEVNAWVKLYTKRHQVFIAKEIKSKVGHSDWPNDTVFDGFCPSINEFRKICKFVGL